MLIRFITISILFFITVNVTPAFTQEFEVEKINFHGKIHFKKSELRDLLHSENGEDFDQRLVKLDKIVLTNFYRRNGFLTVDVGDSIHLDKNKNEAVLDYYINTGYQYHLGKVQFSGVRIFSDARLRETFGEYAEGAVFNESVINDIMLNIEDLYYNSGKPFVNISLDYRFEQDSLVTVLFDIVENHTVYLDKIHYFGLELVQKFIIRRELEFEAGEMYNRKKMEKSQQNIYGTGLFEYVRFEIKPKENDTVNVDLNIFVRERDPQWVGLRAGFAYEQEQSYGNKFRLTAEGGHRNLFGTARSVSLHLAPSFWYDFVENEIANVENEISFAFIEPWVFFTRTPAIFRISYTQFRHLSSADFDVINAGVNVSHLYENDIELTGTISAKYIDQLGEGVIDTTLDPDLGKKDEVYSISLYGKQDKRSNYFNPSDGAFTDLSLTFSQSFGKIGGGGSNEVTYLTVVSTWSRYQPLALKIFGWKPNITLATRLKGGSIFETGKTQRIPISDLFFAGGATTVRGYGEQLLGPVSYLDDTKRALGGKMMFLSNAELRIPIFWLFVGEIFVDGGNVWREIRNFKILDYKFSAGAGLALLTPIGPIRFDYGWKLMPEKEEDPANFHLGFYFAF